MQIAALLLNFTVDVNETILVVEITRVSLIIFSNASTLKGGNQIYGVKSCCVKFCTRALRLCGFPHPIASRLKVLAHGNAHVTQTRWCCNPHLAATNRTLVGQRCRVVRKSVLLVSEPFTANVFSCASSRTRNYVP